MRVASRPVGVYAFQYVYGISMEQFISSVESFVRIPIYPCDCDDVVYVYGESGFVCVRRGDWLILEEDYVHSISTMCEKDFKALYAAVSMSENRYKRKVIDVTALSVKELNEVTIKKVIGQLDMSWVEDEGAVELSVYESIRRGFMYLFTRSGIEKLGVGGIFVKDITGGVEVMDRYKFNRLYGVLKEA